MRRLLIFGACALPLLLVRPAQAHTPGGCWRWWGLGWGDGYHAPTCRRHAPLPPSAYGPPFHPFGPTSAAYTYPPQYLRLGPAFPAAPHPAIPEPMPAPR
jgi:hypothetical protein